MAAIFEFSVSDILVRCRKSKSVEENVIFLRMSHTCSVYNVKMFQKHPIAAIEWGALHTEDGAVGSFSV
jgi:hypothetical protein